MKQLINKFLNNLGYSVSRLPDVNSLTDTYSDTGISSVKFTDVEKLARIGLSIPGMISTESGKFLYTLCYMQSMKGDVVEVGAWQGRSTSFIARAVRASGNGSFFSIDHFKGNVGRESTYVVGKEDLSDLRNNFEMNMQRLGLWETITLLDMPNADAAKLLQDKKVRFLFIDGDHTKEGVRTDIRLFFPLLMPGSIIVFDDFRPEFPGLVEAIDELLAKQSASRIFSYRNTLVFML